MMGKAKLFLLAFFGFLVIGVLPIAAQEDKWGKANTSELFYVNVQVEKVFTYRKGYIVVYRKGGNSIATTYLPYEWFRVHTRKAELVQLPDGNLQPSMTVFFKEGKFHAVRLYVAKRTSHLTWGMLPSTTNVDDRFENVESIDVGIESKQ